jgi:hypothetical protein
MSSITEKEEYEKAKKAGELEKQTSHRARSVRYDKKNKRVVIELLNGCTFMFPPDLAQVLCDASDEELSDVSVMPQGFALEWPKIDAHFSVDGLIKGVFGNQKWMTKLQQNTKSKPKQKKISPTHKQDRRCGVA